MNEATISTIKTSIDTSDAGPLVSIIIPVFNEAMHIGGTLDAVLRQNFPTHLMEVIVVDGKSTDRTRDVVLAKQKENPRIRLVDNPERIVSSALNIGLKVAKGDVIMRMDGHCEYPVNYISEIVKIHGETKADNVGGVLLPIGRNYISKAIAAAYYAPGGVGGALKGHAGSDDIRDVDAVHGGCWKRERLLEVGGFDETMVRNQDDELSFRLRKAGGRILQASSVRVKYAVRDSLRKLFMQFAQYGYWKVRVIRKHPRQSSLRHYLPSLLVLCLVVLLLLSPILEWAFWLFAGVAGVYLAAIFSAALFESIGAGLKLWPGIATALMMMHFGYGFGFLVGLVRCFGRKLPLEGMFEKVTR